MRAFCTTLLFLLFNIFCFGQDLVFNHLIAENGLSQNSVFTITQDAKGFMWYGTRYGLNRYDGVNFKLFVSKKDNPYTLTDDYITASFVDRKGILWVGTVNGLNKYDEKLERFERIYLRLATTKSHTFITNIYQDSAGNIWVNTQQGLFLLKNGIGNDFVEVATIGMPKSLSSVENFSIVEDHKHNYWLGTSKGLVKFVYQKGKIEVIREYTNLLPFSLNRVAIVSIVQVGPKLWMGTENEGLICFDMESEQVKSFPKTTNGLVHNSIRKLIKTSQKEILIATQEGLSVLNPITHTFKSYQNKSSLTTSLNQNSIYSLFEDNVGSIWLGTYYGGVNVTYANPTPFNNLKYDDTRNGLNHNIVSSIVEEGDGNLWIGTEGGGLNYYNIKTKNLNYYRNSLHDKNSLGSDFVKKVYKDHDGGLWIGAHGGGLNYFDKTTQSFKHYVIQKNINQSRTEIVAILESNDHLFYVGTQTGLYVFKRTSSNLQPLVLRGNLKIVANHNIKFLFEDSFKNLWVCTTKGIFKFAPNGEYKQFTPKNASNSVSKSSNYCNFIFEDSNKDIWIGLYYGGLMLLDKNKNQFNTSYDVNNGLPNNNVLSIVEDNKKNLWISTSKGLSKFNLKDKNFLNYTVVDGLAADEFNYNSYYKNKKGEIFFGGYKGLTFFNPNDIKINTRKNNIVFTDLYLDDKLLGIKDESNILQNSLNHTKKLTFKSNQNIFTIKFALLNFIKTSKNKYAYKLEGINNTWIETSLPAATYINLPSGDYKLLIKGANNDGVWSDESAIDIKILPPFYKTWWAILVYLIIISAVLFFIVRYFFLKQLLLKEDQLHQLKLNFFTNVSHEIRTHITLLLAPIEKLLEQAPVDKSQEKSFINIKASSNRLLRLVNELMDFRKAETKNLKLAVKNYDIILVISEILNSFKEYLANKNINLVFNHERNPIFLNFDKLQLEKVFFNILINAYKFTPNNGTIKVEVVKGNENITVSIEDNGEGIDKKYLDKLFNNFFQVEDYKIQNTGYGIGLALSKNIVELHNGSITVDSKKKQFDNDGFTKFIITLPLGTFNSLSEEMQPEVDQFSGGNYLDDRLESEDEDLNVNYENNKLNVKYQVLVVDDNKDIRELIKNNLSDTYKVTLARNGFEGLQAAISIIPDLIISDVMMPNMNGYALCRSLKTDERTSHIPIILLTAKDSEDDFIYGYNEGADQYLTKPFSNKLLKLNVENLIKLKENIRSKFTKRFLLEPGEIILDSVDEKFLAKLIYEVETNLENEMFNVHFLAENVGMSTSVLYKKIKAITNLSVNEFIKSIRLKRAAQILIQRKYTVYEISYMVGFADSKYFSKEFRKQFGLTPTEYLKKSDL